MEDKTEQWNLRVTPAQDMAVRRIIAETGKSLNDFVVRHAVEAARATLADRAVIVVSNSTWDEFQAAFDLPAVPRPELTALLADESVLER